MANEKHGVGLQKIPRNPQTDVDVRRLREHFRDLLPDGRLIEHGEIEKLIGVKRTRSYYRTATKAWRRSVFEEDRLYLDGRTALGRGFKVLTPDDMVRFANKRVREAGRILKRAVLVAAAPSDEALTDANARAYRARLLAAAQELATTHTETMKALTSALRRPTQLPRANPVP